MIVMTDKEFLKAINKALNSKTLYVMGCFGAPMSTKLDTSRPQGKNRYSCNNAYNMAEPQHSYIMAASEDTFGFDCVNLIKGCASGWCADKTKLYGGSNYNVIRDQIGEFSANSMIARGCYDVSSDFSNIVPGECVWMDGHVGVYVGDGYVVEATARWEHKVLKSVCLNVMNTADIHRRRWSRHGKLKFIEYTGQAVKPAVEPVKPEEKEPETIQYKVQKGDNLTKIAAMYNTTPDKILERNQPTHAKMTRNLICTGWVIEIKVGEK